MPLQSLLRIGYYQQKFMQNLENHKSHTQSSGQNNKSNPRENHQFKSQAITVWDFFFWYIISVLLRIHLIPKT